MKTKTLWLVAGAAAILIAVAGVFWWQQGQVRAEVLAGAIPVQPDLAAWPAEFKQRVDACEAAIRNGDDPMAKLGELSALYHANGYYPEAGQCYFALEYLDPDNPTWPHRHAMILAGYGDAEQAMPRFQTVIRLAPRYVPARLRYADLLLKQNDFGAAAAAYRDLLEFAPEEPYALLGLARCHFEQEEWEAARERLEEVVALTNYQLGYDLIVTVYNELGLEARADLIRGRAKAFGSYRDPYDPWIETLISDCYDVYRLSIAGGEAMGAGKPEKAVEFLEQALKYAPESESIHFQLGVIHKQTGSWDAARFELERCVEIDPGFPDGWVQLSELFTRLGRADEADRVLAEGLVHCPDSPGLQLMNARRLKSRGQLDPAITAFKNSIRLRPNEAEAYIELASVYFERDEVDKGMELLKEALKAEPDQPVALTTLAFGAIVSGDEAEARKWMQKAANQPRVGSDDRQALAGAFEETFGRRYMW